MRKQMKNISDNEIIVFVFVKQIKELVWLKTLTTDIKHFVPTSGF